MTAIALLTAIGVLAGKIVDFGKYATNRDVNGMLTQLTAWIAGVVSVFWAAHADGAEGLVLPGTNQPLAHLSVVTLVLLGMTSASLFSFAYDVKKAVDNSDSAVTPELMGRGAAPLSNAVTPVGVSAPARPLVPEVAPGAAVDHTASDEVAYRDDNPVQPRTRRTRRTD